MSYAWAWAFAPACFFPSRCLPVQHMHAVVLVHHVILTTNPTQFAGNMDFSNHLSDFAHAHDLVTVLFTDIVGFTVRPTACSRQRWGYALLPLCGT